MEQSSKIYIAGHNGMVGSAIMRKLIASGYNNIVFRDSRELDLRDQRSVHDFFVTEKPEYVFLAAAKVGGILANITYKADFLYDNLIMQSNIIHAAHLNDVNKLLFLGSSCIYPKMAPQPIIERVLLTGPLEPTNEPYAIAKIAGIKLCDSYRYQYDNNFISVMPTNLYGDNDNYDLNNSHVLPALLKKFHDARVAGDDFVEVWGSGTPKREFLHVDDLADACLFAMKVYNSYGPINIGSGQEVTIAELAAIIKRITGFEGNIKFDTSRPDGTPRKLLDSSKLTIMGWRASIPLEEGIKQVYDNLPWHAAASLEA